MNQDRRTMRFGGAIIAGGQARRLGGVAKGLISHDDGRSVVERLLREMSSAGVEETVIVTNEPEPYATLGHDLIADLRPGEGPLAGIEAALTHLQDRCDATVILACDMPSVSARELRTLIDTLRDEQVSCAYAKTDENFCHTMCAVVENNVLARVSATLDAGIRRPRKVWMQVPNSPVWFPDDSVFRNLNTKEDLLKWRQDVGTGPVPATLAPTPLAHERAASRTSEHLSR